MFAVIETGGKQYKVQPGEKLKIEKIAAAENGSVVFEKVLLKGDGDQITVGTPHIAGAAVHAKIVQQGRAKKVLVFRYHSKTRYRKKKGHRQHFTEVEITEIR